MTAKNENIEKGDYVYPKDSHPHLFNTFMNVPQKVERVERNDLMYAGNGFVYINVFGKEYGFYLSAIKKVQ